MASERGSKQFRWQAYGGLGEVGMNCMVFRFGDTAVPVDAGILFADPNDFGIESLHADYAPILESYRPRDWIFTHAHEDHIGAASAIFAAADRLGIEPPRLLAPRFAAALMREKLSEDVRFPHAKKHIHRIETFERDTVLSLAPDLDVRFIEIRHSCPDSFSLAFDWRSPDGPLSVLHTADFKLDFGRFEDGVRDLKIYDVFPNGLDFLFVDSTNSERPGHSVSELAVIPGLEKLFQDADGRVFVTLFASNVYRVAAILGAAARCGRYVSIAGRSLQTAYRLGHDLKMFDEMPSFSEARVLEPLELARHEPHKQLVICSGTQGELRSVLWKLAQGQHPDFALGSGDTVIFSSKLIPGNERSVGRLMNGLLRQGARVLTGDEAKAEAGGPIHASGHARGDEIRALMRFLKPRHIVPVHGELRQLQACGRLGREEGRAWGLQESDVTIVENGTQLSFERKDDGWGLVRRDLPLEPVARRLRFDRFTSSSRDPFLFDRKRAASGGCLVVSLDSGGRYRISTNGIWPEEAIEHLDRDAVMSEIEDWVFQRYKHFKKLGRESFGDPTIEAEAADDLGRFVRKLCGIRPLVVFHWMEQS